MCGLGLEARAQWEVAVEGVCCEEGRGGLPWSALLYVEGDRVDGNVEIPGEPAKLYVSGKLTSGEYDLYLHDGAAVVGKISGTLQHRQTSGSLELADGRRGLWSGNWQLRPAGRPRVAQNRWSEVEVVAADALPLKRRSREEGVALVEVARQRDPREAACGLISSGAAVHMSSGVVNALQRQCIKSPAFGTDGTDGQQGLGEGTCVPPRIYCYEGSPESNPPMPRTVSGELVHPLTRSVQVWPHITQSEPSIGVANNTASVQLVAYNSSTGPPCGFDSTVGYSRRLRGTWQEAPDQWVVPAFRQPSGVVDMPISDPVTVALGASDFGLFYVFFRRGQFNLCCGIGSQRWNPDLGKFPVDTSNNPTTFDALVPPVPDPINDKPWAVVSRDGGEDQIHLCWTRFFHAGFTTFFTQIWYKNVATGETRAVSDVFVSPSIAQGCQVVTRGHDVYVFWAAYLNPCAGEGNLAIVQGAHSGDGGSSFSAPFNVSQLFPLPFSEAGCLSCGGPSLNGFVRTAPLPSAILNRVGGHIWVAFAQLVTGGESRITLAESRDNGASWRTTFIDDGPPGDRWMPALAFDPSTQRLRIMWYDRRDDQPANLNVSVYYDTGSFDASGNLQFGTDQPLTTAPFGVPRLAPVNFDCSVDYDLELAPCYMGDYNSIHPLPGGGFVHAWGDNSLKFRDAQMGQDVPDPDVRAWAGC